MTRAECQAIWKAAKRGDDARLSSLLSGAAEGGDDVARNQIDWVHHRRGTTALMVAAASSGRRVNGSAECVRLLLAHGANANATSLSQDMSTPLHFAAEGKGDDSMVVELLLGAGADPFAVNRRGHTPLDVARIRHRKFVAHALTDRMQVHADWLYLRGTFRWRRRWGVLLACNTPRSATELCIFKDRDTVRPEAVLLLDETATAFRFGSADSYSWLKRADAFTLSKPVMCQSVSRDKFTRAPVCRKTMSFGNSETRNIVFAADDETKLTAWMRALSRSQAQHLGGVGSGSLTASSSFGPRSTDIEMFYWPHELRQSLALQSQPSSDPMPVELAASAIVAGSMGNSQTIEEADDSDPFPPSERRLERTQSAGTGVARPERSVTFSPVINTSDEDVSPLEQLRQQYRDYQRQRRELERELATQDSSQDADNEGVVVANQQDATSGETATQVAEPEPTATDNQPTRELCLICADAPRDAVCTPCGHLSACYSCLRTIIRSTRTCPICRARIRSVMRIYDA
jgi:hypothetical protein